MKQSRLLAFLLVVCLLASGCGPQWKKKFIRKKKVVRTTQPILTLISNIQATYPPEVRYQEHFAYWKSWHSELLASLGQIRKRDLRYLNGTISELQSMEELLAGPPAKRLGEILTELRQMEEGWSLSPQTGYASTRVRTRLQQLEREINRDFHYSEVKDAIAKPLG